MEVKLLQHFKDRICIQKGKTRRGNLLFSRNLDAEEALRKDHSLKSKLATKLRDVALTLRSMIAEAEHNPLPTSNLYLSHILSGEVNVPDEVLQLFTYLINDPDSRTSQSLSKQRRVRSISEDVVFATTSGRKKPLKHLKLGLAMKSLCGSKQVIEMLNRYGHCVSYSTVEEIQIELTFKACQESKISPPEMKLRPEYCTGLAFDNYDRFVET